MKELFYPYNTKPPSQIMGEKGTIISPLLFLKKKWKVERRRSQSRSLLQHFII
jgi:hypothetical protein